MNLLSTHPANHVGERRPDRVRRELSGGVSQGLLPSGPRIGQPRRELFGGLFAEQVQRGERICVTS
jgi:hypothetical protein